MRDFAELYAQLDTTTSSNAKLAALQAYFKNASDADSAWAVYFLAGGRPRQLVPTKLLRSLATQAANIPEWLFEESYQAVGDLAETISLLLPQSHDAADPVEEASFATWVEDRLLPLRGLPAEELLARLLPLLRLLDGRGRLLCVKLITGSFRVGVSKLLVTRALSALTGIDAKRIAQRLVGYTDLAARPAPEHFQRLVASAEAGSSDERDLGQPYPFFLAHALQSPTAEFDAQIGAPGRWQIEWKWDGIRAQLVKRGGQIWIWSRGEELVTERFPELAALAAFVPDGSVIDGEIVAWKQDRVQPFALLQQRIGRKTLNASILQKAPVVLLAYDLLEWDSVDGRQQSQTQRRAQLEALVARIHHPALQISPLLHGTDWHVLDGQRSAARELGVEGLMLKDRQAQYGVGRTKDVGVWWKWKIDPYSVDAVLIYAQRGHGRRASLYSDFTFAVWDAPPTVADRKLVPFAKAYSGLTDAEMRQVDAIVSKTTVEKFGPVRSVTPTLVFELGFEGIARSTRHKSGIAVRFPRMLRWRHDKPVADADTLETLNALLPGSGG